MTITANMVSLSLSTVGPPGSDALVSLLGVDAGIPASEGNQRVTLARSAGRGVRCELRRNQHAKAVAHTACATALR